MCLFVANPDAASNTYTVPSKSSAVSAATKSATSGVSSTYDASAYDASTYGASTYGGSVAWSILGNFAITLKDCADLGLEFS